MMRDASSDFQEHKSRKVSQFEEDPSNPFHQLPSEIIEMIFSFLFVSYCFIIPSRIDVIRVSCCLKQVIDAVRIEFNIQI